jgi:hypothetical protein
MCGVVRYEGTGDPVFMGACHCRECQYVSGGAPANAIVMPKAAVTRNEGKPSRILECFRPGQSRSALLLRGMWNASFRAKRRKSRDDRNKAGQPR